MSQKQNVTISCGPLGCLILAVLIVALVIGLGVMVGGVFDVIGRALS